MKVSVVTVGRMRSVLRESVGEYEDRVSRYWKFEVMEVDAGVGRGGDVAAEQVRAAEAERILSRVPDRTELWALTRAGRQMSSPELARAMGERALESAVGVTFVIGGAYGLDASVTGAAARRLSLSRMTLPHELARLVLAEQLYRAGTILRNEPYHKGAT